MTDRSKTAKDLCLYFEGVIKKGGMPLVLGYCADEVETKGPQLTLTKVGKFCTTLSNWCWLSEEETFGTALSEKANFSTSSHDSFVAQTWVQFHFLSLHANRREKVVCGGQSGATDHLSDLHGKD